MPELGLIADIHGDWASFVRAIGIFERERVTHILCAGDIVERGAHADRIVSALQKLPTTCVKGNHEYSILQAQSRRRGGSRTAQLMRIGRIVGDDTLDFIAALPDTARLTVAGVRILVARLRRGAMCSTFSPIASNKFDQLAQRYGDMSDVIVLGHTHRPMHVRTGHCAYSIPAPSTASQLVTATCAILSLPELTFRVFDLATYTPREIAIVER